MPLLRNTHTRPMRRRNPRTPHPARPAANHKKIKIHAGHTLRHKVFLLLFLQKKKTLLF
jgi:hypothetical protein